MGYQTGNDRQVIWRARTERKHVGSSGKIRWRIMCVMARTIKVTKQAPEEVPMFWGMARVFTYPAGKWKLTWTRYDGAKKDYNSTDLESSLFQVKATGDSVRITTFGQ